MEGGVHRQKALTEEYIPQISGILLEHRIINRPLPQCGILIFDEAHKLPDAARQMYGMALDSAELEQLVSGAYRSVGSISNRKEAALLCGELLLNGLFFEMVRREAGTHYDKSCQAFNFSSGSLRLQNRMEQERAKVMLLMEHSESICWLEHTGASTCRLCVLTSATLSIGGDFTHLMHQTGIDLLEQHRILTASKASPFDYENHALLYLPEDMPFPDGKNGAYMEKLLERLMELICESHGHTLVLYISYRMMEVMYRELSKPGRVAYPLFCMGKGWLETHEEVYHSGKEFALYL